MHRTFLLARTACAVILAGLLGACGGADISYEGVEDTVRTPQGRGPDVGDPNRETIFGAPINTLFDGSRPDDQPGGTGLGVNAFLWRASLDTLAFLPPLSTDPVGGVIVYDWYVPPEAPHERFKVTVYILDTRLTANAMRVGVNRQVTSEGEWRDASIAEDTPVAIENAILTRARELRIAWLGQ